MTIISYAAYADAEHCTCTPARASESPVPSVPTLPDVAARYAQELNEIRRRLELINSTVAVAACALEGENAEIDMDVANTLRISVRNALADQVERIDALIHQLQ